MEVSKVNVDLHPQPPCVRETNVKICFSFPGWSHLQIKNWIECIHIGSSQGCTSFWAPSVAEYVCKPFQVSMGRGGVGEEDGGGLVWQDSNLWWMIGCTSDENKSYRNPDLFKNICLVFLTPMSLCLQLLWKCLTSKLSGGTVGHSLLSPWAAKSQSGEYKLCAQCHMS